MDKLEGILVENPVIAGIRDDNGLHQVLNSKAEIVFVLYGNIMSIVTICRMLKAKNKTVFVHVDMIEGLRGDAAGIEFIKKYADPYGIISTKPSNIKHAKQMELKTILRIFIIDSLSLRTGIKNAYEVSPDAIEVMPGVASKIISSIQKEVKVPVIAGGLIDSKKDVYDSIGAGALAVSTTAQELWNL